MKRERRELPIISCWRASGCEVSELLRYPPAMSRLSDGRRVAAAAFRGCAKGRVPAERGFSLNIGNESNLLALSKVRKWAAESRRNENEDSSTDRAACT